MKRIMFVCHGNICRSPMAEFIMKHLAEINGKKDEFYIASSATSTEEIYNGVGNPIYPPAQRELEKHGIYYSDRRAVQLKKEDYGIYDVFYCMDSKNVKDAIRIFGNDRESKTVRLLGNKDVSDPWYTNRFDIAFNDIYDGCKRIFNMTEKDLCPKKA